MKIQILIKYNNIWVNIIKLRFYPPHPLPVSPQATNIPIASSPIGNKIQKQTAKTISFIPNIIIHK